MIRRIAALLGRRSSRLALVVWGLPLVLAVSCAAGPSGASPTPAAPPSVPPITPILPLTDTPAATAPPQPTSTPTPVPAPTETGPVEYTVQPGDTLLGLARQYGVPMAAIQLQNGMGDATVVKAGKALSIPPPIGWEGASSFWVVHLVREGETLIGIAHAYGLDAEAVQAVNGLADADAIGIGQELILPLDAPAVARVAAPTATPAPATSTPAPTPEAAEASPSLTATLPADAPLPAAVPPANLAAWPREIARLINQVRAEHGLPPLTYNETLARAAQAHANDCTQRGWCSHTGSDGADIRTRIVRAGYDPSSWAECWAQTQSPQRAVEVWMDETPPNDPHRRTLLTTWLSEIGLGVSESEWGNYIIADFGRP